MRWYLWFSFYPILTSIYRQSLVIRFSSSWVRASPTALSNSKNLNSVCDSTITATDQPQSFSCFTAVIIIIIIITKIMVITIMMIHYINNDNNNSYKANDNHGIMEKIAIIILMIIIMIMTVIIRMIKIIVIMILISLS